MSTLVWAHTERYQGTSLNPKHARRAEGCGGIQADSGLTDRHRMQLASGEADGFKLGEEL